MKSIAAYWKYLRYLIWVGIMLATAGLVSGLLSGWDSLPLALLIGGIVLIGIWFLLLGQARPEFWGQRSTQSSTNALVATVSVIVILLSLNVLAVRHGQRLDLTENQIFTLAPETTQTLRNLEQPTKIWIFDAVRNPTDQQLLESYERQSDQFSYEYVDPNAQPVLAQEFGVRSLGEVYLEAGDQRQRVQRLSQTERLTEPRLTAQITRLAQGESPTAYFVVGHGEYSVDDFQGGFTLVRDGLEQKNIAVEPLNLAEGGVPDDADVVIVAGPQQQFFKPEIKALEQYLENGGGLLLMVDPNTDPGLEPLLNDWGVTLEDRLVLDTSGQGQAVGLGPAAPLISNYGEHPITEAFQNGRSFYPVARPISIQDRPRVTATPILITDEQTRAENIVEGGEINVDPTQAPEGPFYIGAALSRPVQSLPTASANTSTDSGDNPDAETVPPDESGNEATDATESEAPAEESPAAETAVETEQEAEPEAANSEEAVSAEAESAETEVEAEDAETATPESSENTDAESAETEVEAEENPEVSENTDAESAETETPASEADEPEVTETESPESETAESGNESRLVVIGNSTFATDGVFNQQLNGDVFLNSVSWLAQEDDATLSIRAKEVTDRRIVLSTGKQIFLSLLAWFILPLIGFAAAVFMWWRRR
ncbi:MAG: Gldg family protein [Thainema sp.]